MIKYVDFLNGNDGGGDGTPGNPFKTVAAVIAGLGGGDEVRIAKGPENTPLTGVVDWIDKSAIVVGHGTLFTFELAVGDFIIDPYGFFHEVVSIESDESLTTGITHGWRGETRINRDTSEPNSPFWVYNNVLGVTTEKVGVILNNSEIPVGIIEASGASAESKLKISGGWDLSSELQDGKTNFVDNEGSVSDGAVLADTKFVLIEELGFFKHAGHGIRVLFTDSELAVIDCGIEIRNVRGVGNGRGIEYTGVGVVIDGFISSDDQEAGVFSQDEIGGIMSSRCRLSNIKVGFTLGGDGLWLHEQVNCIFEDISIIGGVGSGINYGMYSSGNNKFSRITARRLNTGISYNGGSNDEFVVLRCNDNQNGFAIDDVTTDLFIDDIQCNSNDNTGFQAINTGPGPFFVSGIIGYLQACENDGIGLAIAGSLPGAIKFGTVELFGNLKPIETAVGAGTSGIQSISIEKLNFGGSTGYYQRRIGLVVEWPDIPTDVVSIVTHATSYVLKVGDKIFDIDADMQEIVEIIDSDNIRIAKPYTGTPGESGDGVNVGGEATLAVSNDVLVLNPLDQFWTGAKSGLFVSYMNGGGAENILMNGRTRQNTTVPRGGSGSCLEFQLTNKNGRLEHGFFIRSTHEISKTFSIYAQKDADFNGSVEMAVFHANRLVADWKDITPTEVDVYERKTISVSGSEVRFDNMFEIRVRVKDGDAGKVFVDDIAISAIEETWPWVQEAIGIAEDVTYEFVPDMADNVSVSDYGNPPNDPAVILGLDPFELIDGTPWGVAILDGVSGQCFLLAQTVGQFHVNDTDFTMDGVASIDADGTGRMMLLSRGTEFGLAFDHDTNQLVAELGGNQYLSDVFEPKFGTEQHFAIVRSGTDVLFFVDGVQFGTQADNSFIGDFGTGEGLIIGRWNYQNMWNWKGQIRWARLSQTALWTTEFTPPLFDPSALVTSPTVALIVFDALAGVAKNVSDGVILTPQGSPTIFKSADAIGDNLIVAEDAVFEVI
jgi:hypothetical protein